MKRVAIAAGLLLMAAMPPAGAQTQPTCPEFRGITCDRIPVRPGAHYMIGGITVDQDGRTNVPGLWAAGEVSSSGLHGANRLGASALMIRHPPVIRDRNTGLDGR